MMCRFKPIYYLLSGVAVYSVMPIFYFSRLYYFLLGRYGALAPAPLEDSAAQPHADFLVFLPFISADFVIFIVVDDYLRSF